MSAGLRKALLILGIAVFIIAAIFGDVDVQGHNLEQLDLIAGGLALAFGSQL